MTTWKLINNGAIITESVHTFSSSEGASEAFQEILGDSKAIIENTKIADSPSESSGRIVKVYGNPETREGAAQIIRLNGKDIQHIDAASLKYALGFEKDGLKINF